MHRLRHAVATQAWGLLRVLLLWLGPLPAHPGGRDTDMPADLVEKELHRSVGRPAHWSRAPLRSRQAGWKTSVRTSMLSRGRASGGVVGSVNEVCGMKRAGMSVLVSAIFKSSASSRRISGT